jgi:1-acyl-sn-glycerol-3-phosphate acyltransferase
MPSASDTPVPAQRTRLPYGILQMLAAMFFTFVFRGRAFGLRNIPRRGGLILASNHQSFYDPVLVAVLSPRPCNFVARDTLFRHPLFARLISWLGAFPVKRAAADVSAIKESVTRIKGGGVLVAFPEGTRTPDGQVQRIERGIITIARRAKCPVVPVAVEGAFEAWSRHHKAPGLGRLWVEYGEPIPSELICSLPPGEAAELLNARMRAVHNRLRSRYGREPIQYPEGSGPASDADQAGAA